MTPVGIPIAKYLEELALNGETYDPKLVYVYEWGGSFYVRIKGHE
jgi:hypothetical protein